MSTRSATIVSPSWVTDRGASVPDWAVPTLTVESGWRFTPMPAAELKDLGRQGVTTMLKGSGPSTTALTEHKRMRVDGLDYEVDGSVQRWPSLTGDMEHVEVVLKRVDG